MENILVVGANGATGKKIVNLLKVAPYFKPIAMVRKEAQLEQFKKEGVDTVLADLEEDVSHAVKHIDKIIFAAGSGGKKVIAVDQEGAKSLIDISIKANIKKFVMLSSMGADKPEEAEDLKAYLKAKQEADEYLKASSLNYTIVRPGSLNNAKGTGKISLKNHFEAHGTISRDDVAQTLVQSLHDDAGTHKTFEILQGDTPIGKALPSVS